VYIFVSGICFAPTPTTPWQQPQQHLAGFPINGNLFYRPAACRPLLRLEREDIELMRMFPFVSRRFQPAFPSRVVPFTKDKHLRCAAGNTTYPLDPCPYFERPTKWTKERCRNCRSSCPCNSLTLRYPLEICESSCSFHQ
jgi:hypothetical protein